MDENTTGINVGGLSAEEIENLKVDKEKELRTALEDQSFVQMKLNSIKTKEIEIRRQLNDLTRQRHEFKEIMDKSRYRIACIKQDITILTAEFWRKTKGY